MFFLNCYIIVCVHFSFYKFIWCLEELPPVEENDIVATEAVIRLTINKLFSNLRLNYNIIYNKSKDYSTVHKYFTSLSLQDYENLIEISRQTRVGHKNKNNSTDFIAIINEILAEEYVFTEKNDTEINDKDENVIHYIEHFLKKLHVLKEIYTVDKTYVNINTDVLKLLKDSNIKTNYSSNAEFSSYKSEENYTLLDENEFWKPSGRRIFKGDRTKITDYPFMAAIQIFNQFHCAGSIIKSDLIITASSCLQLAYNNRLFRENPAFLSARVGSSFYNMGGEVIPVLEVYFHPGYDPSSLKNNICLLRLSRHLKFRKKSRRVKKINFDRHESTLPMTTPGITIVGWGAKENSHVIGTWKNILSFAVLDVYSLGDCEDVYSKAYVTKKNFCAGFISRGGGACNRDVGGPGIDNGKLMGVVSFGSPVCGALDKPTVFTKVGFYTDWIEEIMEQDVPTSRKRTTLKPYINPFTAPPSYKPPKATTFKIAPLTGKKMSPIPISEVDEQLRMSGDRLFKEFLATMFTSHEISEYQDIFNVDGDDNYVTGDVETTTKEIVTENSHIIPTIRIAAEDLDEKEVESLEEIKQQTQIVGFSNEESNSDSVQTPIIDNQLPVVYNLNKDITNILQNDQEKDSSYENQTIDDSSKNETVLTLLYLSDDDKKIKTSNSNKTDKGEIYEGLSIPSENFEDLTRSKQNVLNILPESELYALLTDVIQEEVEKVNSKT